VGGSRKRSLLKFNVKASELCRELVSLFSVQSDRNSPHSITLEADSENSQYNRPCQACGAPAALPQRS
jgi:hypothetical protein